jgi:hypothetical protein
MRRFLITLTALGAVAVALPAVSAKRGLFHVILRREGNDAVSG